MPTYKNFAQSNINLGSNSRNGSVNLVTGRSNWANGVLLRAIALPGEDERIASGPGLLAKRFSLNRLHNNLLATKENSIWLANSTYKHEMQNLVRTTRIGISQAKNLPWRWYLQSSRSVSKRAKGDRCPTKMKDWDPLTGTNL